MAEAPNKEKREQSPPTEGRRERLDTPRDRPVLDERQRRNERARMLREKNRSRTLGRG